MVYIHTLYTIRFFSHSEMGAPFGTKNTESRNLELHSSTAASRKVSCAFWEPRWETEMQGGILGGLKFVPQSHWTHHKSTLKRWLKNKGNKGIHLIFWEEHLDWCKTKNFFSIRCGSWLGRGKLGGFRRSVLCFRVTRYRIFSKQWAYLWPRHIYAGSHGQYGQSRHWACCNGCHSSPQHNWGDPSNLQPWWGDRTGNPWRTIEPGQRVIDAASLPKTRIQKRRFFFFI